MGIGPQGKGLRFVVQGKQVLRRGREGEGGGGRSKYCIHYTGKMYQCTITSSYILRRGREGEGGGGRGEEGGGKSKYCIHYTGKMYQCTITLCTLYFTLTYLIPCFVYIQLCHSSYTTFLAKYRNLTAHLLSSCALTS